MTKAPPRLALVVDPDPGAAAALGPALRREGYQLRVARDGSRALQLAITRVPDVMLVDEGTPIVAPRTLIRLLRSNPRTALVPILYAGTDAARLPDGATGFVRKPLEPNEILAAMRTALAPAEKAAERGQERVEGSLAQADDLAALAERLPPADALLTRAPQGEGAEDVLEVLGAVEDGLRELLSEPQRLSALLDRSSASELETSRAVLRLLASGEVRVAEPPPEARADAPIVSPADAQALRDCLRRGPVSGTATGKVVVKGGDTTDRRTLLDRLRTVDGYRSALEVAPDSAVVFGTVGTFEFPELRLDVVVLPADPLLLPLSDALSAGALVTLDLGVGPARDRHPCRDPVEALRTLLGRTAARARGS